MASLLSRFTTFVPNTTILSNDHNQELNRIVNLLNGTTTNLKTVLKTSDAGDPPLELDQLSTGPIQEWYQGGVLKASMTNSGGLSLSGNLSITKANPAISLDNTGSVGEISVAGGSMILGRSAQTDQTINLTTGVCAFAAIPTGPASDPTTDSQLTRKAYVDAKKVSFSISFAIVDPSTATLNQNDFGSVVFPAGGTYTVTKFKVLFMTGSHTSGSSLTFVIGQVGVGARSTAALKLDDTNNTISTIYNDDIGDFTAAENAILTLSISTRSGTITERNVVVIIEGFRTTF